MAQPSLSSSGSSSSGDTGLLQEVGSKQKNTGSPCLECPSPGIAACDPSSCPAACTAEGWQGPGGSPKQRDGGCWGRTHSPGLTWAMPSSSRFPWSYFSSPACFAETCQRGGEVPEGSPLAGQHPGKAPHAPQPLPPPSLLDAELCGGTGLGDDSWHRNQLLVPSLLPSLGSSFPPCPRSWLPRELPLAVLCCSARRRPRHRCLPALTRANEAILSSFPASPLPAHAVRRRQEVKVELVAQC